MQSGRTPEELLGQTVRAQFGRPRPAARASDEALREEYHVLADLELVGRLTETQAARLKAVEMELDDRDAASPEAQWMNA